MTVRTWLERSPELGGRVLMWQQIGDLEPIEVNRRQIGLASLPSPMLGLPEVEIERYVFDALVASAKFEWVRRQWWIGPHDKPDIVARFEINGVPRWWIFEIKAARCSWRHYRQAYRYMRQLGELVGHDRVRAFVVAPDLRRDVPWSWGRLAWLPPEWLDQAEHTA